MSTWPDGWREATLTAADIPVTQFALDVLNYWETATPTQPWTNNPLGIPASGFGVPKAFNSAYGAFPTPDSFRQAFVKALKSTAGKAVFHALAVDEKLSIAWRAIHTLQWPGNLTETDYPSTILDAITDGSTANMKVSKAADRKTVGTTPQRNDVHGMIAGQNQALHHAVTNITGATEAMNYVIQRMNGNG